MNPSGTEFLIFFQHKLLTAIHKHYTVEEWAEFAKQHPDVLPVSTVVLIMCSDTV